MKTLIILAALFGGVALPTLAMADAAFTFQGCAMKQIENSNAYTSVIPGCITSQDGSKGEYGTTPPDTEEAEGEGDGDTEGSDTDTKA